MDDVGVFFVDGNVSGATSASLTNGLSVHGELDIFTLSTLERAFGDRRSDSPQGFVLDLRAMTFVDLFGIRALCLIFEQVTRSAHRAVVAPSHSAGVCRMISLAVLNGWLPGAFTFAPSVVPHRLEPTGSADVVGRQ